MIAASSSALSVLPVARELIALHRRQHASRLLAAHHRDARVRPHPEQPRLVGAAAHPVVACAERSADDDGELRHDGVGHGVDHLGAVLRDAARSYWRPTMNPVMFCRKISGTPRRLQSSMKCVAFSADSENSTPLFAMMPTRKPCSRAKPVTSVVAVALLELVEARAVHDARDHLAHFVGLPRVAVDDPVDLVADRTAGSSGRGMSAGSCFTRVQRARRSSSRAAARASSSSAR